MSPEARNSPWGAVPVMRDASLRVRVGCLELWVAHRGTEWRIAERRATDPGTQGWEVSEDDAQPPDTAETTRVVAGALSTMELRLVPRVADRLVVAKPQQRLVVLPGASARVFVTSPVWIDLWAGDQLLRECPTWIPSETWSGANTREGVLCYATRTQASLEPPEPPPSRVITPVTIDNRANEPLEVERVVLPVPSMSVFVGEDGTLWTEVAKLEHDDDVTTASATILAGAPAEATGARRVSSFREQLNMNLLGRAFNLLVGSRSGA